MAGTHVGIGKAGDVAERSPAVYSANVKEDILLQRRLVVLERSKRSAVHRIKVDQKVMYKRFQAKLVRSKLAFARIMKQKEIERELRAKSADGVNAYIPGKADEDYDFLSKLETRPCTASCFSPRIRQPKKLISGLYQESTKDVGQKPMTVVRSKTLEAISMKSMDTGSKLGSRKVQINGIRPATTTGSYRAEDKSIETDHGHMNKITSSTGYVLDKSTSKQSRKGRTVSCSDVRKGGVNELARNEDKDAIRSNFNFVNTGTNETHEDVNVQFPDNVNKRRRKTVTTFAVPENTPPPSPKQTYSRRASKAAEFFQEEDKIDLVKLRLMEAKTKDYSEQVREFCRELDKMSCSHHKPSSDYYTMRLQTSLRRGIEKARLRGQGPSEDDDRRAVGNIHVRSLTLPSINWNFRTDADGRA